MQTLGQTPKPCFVNHLHSNRVTSGSPGWLFPQLRVVESLQGRSHSGADGSRDNEVVSRVFLLSRKFIGPFSSMPPRSKAPYWAMCLPLSAAFTSEVISYQGSEGCAEVAPPLFCCPPTLRQVDG